MSYTLQDKTVLVVGGASGIARTLAERAVADGAEVVLAGRDPAALAPTVAALTVAGRGARARAARVDLADESSIAALAAGIGPLDHVVNLASAPANGPVAGLDRAGIATAFDAKVVGPLLLAKHLAPLLREGGSFLFFSGVVAWKPAPGLTVMGVTNGAVAALAPALAVELAPLRVNALSPGIVDSGAWDGPDKVATFERVAASNPARRVGTTDDVAAAALALLTNPFVTGTTLHVDGGGRWA